MAEKKTVIVVDDDPSVANALEALLTASGYRVAIALTPVQAFAQIKALEACFLLLDVNMPRMNGFELVEELRKRGLGHIPFIFLSAMNRPAYIEKGLAIGAKAYIPKPVNPVELLTILEHHCGPSSIL